MFAGKLQTRILKRMTVSNLCELNDYLSSDLSILRQKNISTSSIYNKKYYEALGVSSTATQGDIKAAYYKLSKLYHPDKNKGSKAAAEKFRDITAAYEILGNYKKRRLYDKGIIHTVDGQQQHTQTDIYEEEPVEDDAQTRFYKAHMKKSKVPHAEGKTPIYNFDEWSRAHYGHSFERHRLAKERLVRREAREKQNALGFKTEMLLLSMVVFIFGCSFMLYQESKLDENKILQKVNNDNTGET